MVLTKSHRISNNYLSKKKKKRFRIVSSYWTSYKEAEWLRNFWFESTKINRKFVNSAAANSYQRLLFHYDPVLSVWLYPV